MSWREVTGWLVGNLVRSGPTAEQVAAVEGNNTEPDARVKRPARSTKNRVLDK